jgi:uncharacterized damage-inducible protein DinB
MSRQSNAVQDQFDTLEKKKRELMLLVSSLSPEDYTHQPFPHKWSVAQATNHIFLSETLSFAYLKKKLSYPDTIPSFHPKSWGGVLLVKLVFLMHYKWKAPKAINMWEDQPILSPKELEEKWSALRQELIKFLETHQAAFGKHLVYRHPYAGRMNMQQMLIFLNDHMAHHMKQIKKIIASQKR